MTGVRNCLIPFPVSRQPGCTAANDLQHRNRLVLTALLQNACWCDVLAVISDIWWMAGEHRRTRWSNAINIAGWLHDWYHRHIKPAGDRDIIATSTNSRQSVGADRPPTRRARLTTNDVVVTRFRHREFRLFMDSGNSKFVLRLALCPSFLLLTHYSCTVCPCGSANVDARCFDVLEMLLIIYLLSAHDCCPAVSLWTLYRPILHIVVDQRYYKSCSTKWNLTVLF